MVHTGDEVEPELFGPHGELADHSGVEADLLFGEMYADPHALVCLPAFRYGPIGHPTVLVSVNISKPSIPHWRPTPEAL